ncbi:hypothetical protein R0381_002766 [Jeongeupia wiesaeckerbachi]|uniref:hypothetical protein n=1 Tax=Jeongeupia wiesaeckerbachi TaxID=3051218 RepID=UPI003D800BD9
MKNFNEVTSKIVASIVELSAGAALAEQLVLADVEVTEMTDFGFFADFRFSPETAVEKKIEEPSRVFVYSLWNMGEEVADILIHSSCGAIQYLEVQFYDRISCDHIDDFEVR